MKQHLGKVLLLILSTLTLFGANVELKLNTPAIYKGEQARFTITAEGSNIEFPTITEIEGFPVHQSGTSSSYSDINGQVSRTVSKSYTLQPTKEVTIPSFSVKVDGKSFTTKPQKLSVLQPQASRSGDPFLIELKIDKKELRVGESVQFKIIYKQRIDAKVERVAISEPKIDNFWVKKFGHQKQYRDGEYIVTEYNYLLFAQKEGSFHIKPIVANVARVVQKRKRDDFFDDPLFESMFSQLEWKKVYSNSLDIKVDPLPNGLELYGDFTILASVDKRKVYANKPVNLTIRVEGVGNIDDVQKFDLNIDNAVVYADKPQIKTFIKNGEHGGIFTQKVAIVSDKNFTIPPIELKFFSKKENSTKSLFTKAIAVTVMGGVTPTTPTPTKAKTAKSEQTKSKLETKVVTKEVQVEKNRYIKYIFFILGALLGVFGTLLFMKYKNSKRKPKESDIIKLIKNTKDDKKLFSILLPYANDDAVISKTLKALEENIYKGAKNSIDKQRLYDYFLDLQELQ